MAKIWYTCSNSEHRITDSLNVRTIKAGALYTAQKHKKRSVLFTPLYVKEAPFSLGVDAARKLMVPPSTDEASIIEQSILICEAHYC
jgi:hypothetical protein